MSYNCFQRLWSRIDPLATEEKLLHDTLKDARMDTDYEMYNGVKHEFFSKAAVVQVVKDAQAASKWKNAFRNETGIHKNKTAGCSLHHVFLHLNLHKD